MEQHKSDSHVSVGMGNAGSEYGGQGERSGGGATLVYHVSTM